LLTEDIDQVVVQAHHLQVPPPEFLGLVKERVEVFEERRRSHEGEKASLS
jgi:hypothetical protein